jgi:O-antigen/teichoic acid export membrane protein
MEWSHDITDLSDMTDTIERSLTHIAKGATLIFTGLIIANILGIIYQIFLARTIGPEEYGVFNLGMSITSILTIFATLGIVTSIPKFIPEFSERKDTRSIYSILRFSVTFILILSVVMGVVLFILAEYISLQIFHEPRLTAVLQVFGLLFPAITLPSLVEAMFRAFHGSVEKIVLIDVGLRVTRIISYLLLFLLSYTLMGAVLSFLIGGMVVVVLSLRVIDRRFFHFLGNDGERIPIATRVLSFSWPLALTGISFIFISKTDTMLLGYFLTSEVIGLYSVALNIATMLTFINSAFSWIFLPLIAKHIAANDRETVESLLKTSSKWMYVVTLPSLFFIILLSTDLIGVLFGPLYVDASVALAILAVGFSLNMLTGLTGSMLVGGGYTRLNLVSELVGGISCIGLNLYLIPLYGIVGAALATTLSYTLRNSAQLIFVHRTFHMHPFRADTIRITLVGLAIFLGLAGVRYLLPRITGIAALLIFGTILGVVFLLLVMVTGCLDDHDRFILRSILTTLRLDLPFVERIMSYGRRR